MINQIMLQNQMYFMNHKLIKEDTMLNEFFYEILTEDEK